MKKYSISILAIALLTVNTRFVNAQDDSRGFKTTLDITINDVGSAICEVTNKYNASYWDYWTKAVGSNTSIINNQLKKVFPKYYLSDFQHSQDANARSNTVKFRIEGMMNINKNGKWEADLERKDPNITKVSNREFLLIEEGETMKIHLPPGTNDAKVEKDSFGNALLTYSPQTGGFMGNLLKYLGIALALVGIGLFIKNRNSTKQTPATKVRTAQATVKEEKIITPPIDEISKN